jgi:hypothetical protein
VGWEARGDELQMKGWRWWGGDAAAARDREMRFDAGWDTWGRRRGVHTRNCWMWVMTWIPERAGNGTKNQVLYDTIVSHFSPLPCLAASRTAPSPSTSFAGATARAHRRGPASHPLGLQRKAPRVPRAPCARRGLAAGGALLVTS